MVAKSTIERLQRALEAGWDPEALTEQYNAAVAEKRAAEAGPAAINRFLSSRQLTHPQDGDGAR